MAQTLNYSNIAKISAGNKKKNKNKNYRGKQNSIDINGLMPTSAHINTNANSNSGLLNSKSDYIKMLLKPAVGSNIILPVEGTTTPLPNHNNSVGQNNNNNDNIQKNPTRIHENQVNDNRSQPNVAIHGGAGRGHNHKTNDAFSNVRYTNNNHNTHHHNARYHTHAHDASHSMPYHHHSGAGAHTGHHGGSSHQHHTHPHRHHGGSHGQILIELSEKDDEVCARTNYQTFLAQSAAFESQDPELEYHLRYMYHCHSVIINEHAESVARTAELARKKATEDWLKSRSAEEQERYLSNYRGESSSATTKTASVASIASATSASSPHPVSESIVESKKMENTTSPQTVVRSGSVTDSGEKPAPIIKHKGNPQKTKKNKPPIAPMTTQQ